MTTIELLLTLNLAVACAILWKIYNSEIMFVEIVEEGKL